MTSKQVCDFLLKLGEIDPESEVNTATLHMANGEAIEFKINSDWWDEDNDILRIGEITSDSTAYMVDCNQIAFISF